MDVDRYLIGSAAFTRALLAGRPTRWLIFVLLGLPWTILVSLLASLHVYDGTTVHWALIPWTELAVLIAAGSLCNLFLWGYIVRLLAGSDEPPEFTGWSRLALDGIKLHTIPLVWVFVPVLLAAAEYAIVSSGFEKTLSGLLLLIVIAIVQVLIILFAVNYAVIGATRFARTGSVREAFHLIAIKETFSRIGIVNYYVGLGIIVVVFVLLTAALNVAALVPVVGPLIPLALGPVVTVFCTRFIAHFCDEDLQPLSRNPAPVPFHMLLPEFLAWAAILLVLLILCFTPLVVITGTVFGLLPW